MSATIVPFRVPVPPLEGAERYAVPAPWESMQRGRSWIAIAICTITISGCITEQGHIHQTTLPGGQPGYAIMCNSQRYDRCLNRATRVCGGAYTIVPQERSSTFRPGDQIPGVGNSELILVVCGK